MNTIVKSFFDKATSTFSHVVYSHEQTLCAVIDPVLGFDIKTGRTNTVAADKIIDFISSNNLEVQWILETHIHADHLTGASYLKNKIGGEIAAGQAISKVQSTFTNIYNLKDDYCANNGHFDHLFEPDELFYLGDIQVKALHVPGHTPADVAYYFNDHIVFVGDTIFPVDVGTARCDFPGGDPAELYNSIQKILALPPTTRLFMCHDYPPNGRAVICETTVLEQKQSNIHVHDGVSMNEFINVRSQRDKSLDAPALLIPSIQLNIRAGVFPPADNDGRYYLKMPIK